MKNGEKEWIPYYFGLLVCFWSDQANCLNLFLRQTDAYIKKGLDK